MFDFGSALVLVLLLDLDRSDFCRAFRILEAELER